MFEVLLRRLVPPIGLLIAVVMAMWAAPAGAVPSFSRQTGQECSTCHVGAFGPQLTPYGIKFKLGGYTEASETDLRNFVSAMTVGTVTHTAKDQVPAPAPFAKNDNAVVQETSLFLAGRISENFGMFSQVTYSGVDRKLALDNVDLRSAFDTQFLGGSTLGVSVNNNPTLQDPFNTLPAWRFPFVSSDLAPSPARAPMIDGMLAGRVVGTTGYFYQPSTGIYAEAGAYAPLARGFLQSVNVVDPADPGPRLTAAAPYGRLAWFKDLHGQSLSFGAFAMDASTRTFGVGGPSDHYTDLGVDAAWQYLGDRTNVFTLSGSFVHEIARLDGTFVAGGATRATQSLDALNITGSWHHDKTWGLTAKYFSTTGNRDALLNPATGSPDSAGFVGQADWTPWGKEGSWGTPWANLRLGLQYTAYTKFDGQTRGASGNNALLAFVWAAL